MTFPATTLDWRSRRRQGRGNKAQTDAETRQVKESNVSCGIQNSRLDDSPGGGAGAHGGCDRHAVSPRDSRPRRGGGCLFPASPPPGGPPPRPPKNAPFFFFKKREPHHRAALFCRIRRVVAAGPGSADDP